MSFFWHSHHTDHSSPRTTSSFFGSPFKYFANSGIKTLLSIALFLIALGSLVLIFPLILAFFVAGLLFFAALLCLSFAWKLFRISRHQNSQTHHIHVDVIDHNDNL